MKFKSTLIIFAVFLALLAFLLIFESQEKKGKDSEGKLVFLPGENVVKVDFKTDGQTITIEKDEDGDWIIRQPLEAAADQFEAGRLADDFTDLKFSRIVEEEPEDLEKYGIPQKEVTLTFKDGHTPVKILIGMENPLDKSFFAKREDEHRVVLIPSHLKSLLDKKVFDFRRKDIFHFETDNVSQLKIQTASRLIEAAKNENQWFLSIPVKSLAEQSRLTGILSSLSGLKAKEFVAETKTDEDLKNCGLDEPAYSVDLDMPAEGVKLSFLLNKKDEVLYATTSQSTKIISVEDTVLADLDKEISDFRDKSVADFYSWEVNKVRIEYGDMDMTVVKSEEGDWHFEQASSTSAVSPIAADRSKVNEFIRTVEGLEAEDWIDPPFSPAESGIKDPEIEITFSVKETEKDREIKILVGKKDAETGKVVVKNTALDYLFKVNGEFLDKLPVSAEDWKIQDSEAEAPDKK